MLALHSRAMSFFYHLKLIALHALDATADSALYMGSETH